MNDYYAFDTDEIDGELIDGFTYCNDDTAYSSVFVQFNDDQAAAAADWHMRMDALQEEQTEMIKGWLKND